MLTVLPSSVPPSGVFETLEDRALRPAYTAATRGLLLCASVDALPDEWEIAREVLLADRGSFDDGGQANRCTIA